MKTANLSRSPAPSRDQPTLHPAVHAGKRAALLLALAALLLCPSLVRAQSEDRIPVTTPTPNCIIEKTSLGWGTKTYDGTGYSATDPRSTWESRYQADLHYHGPVLVQLDDSTWIPCTMIMSAERSSGASAFRTGFGIVTGDEAAFYRYNLTKAKLEKAILAMEVQAEIDAAKAAKAAKHRKSA